MLVAVTCDRREGPAGLGPNVRPGRSEICVSELTVNHLRAVGLTPILLPPGGMDLELVMGVVAGVVITGGAFDIHPSHYGAPVTGRLDRVDAARTGLELALVRECRRRGTPLLGICGGMQALAVGLGGGLIQHVPGHEQAHDPVSPAHPIVCAPGWEWLGQEVNSTHHQAVDPARLGSLTAVAHAPDGTIEAIASGSGRMFGVEWHPELLSTPGSCRIFAAFAARIRARNPSTTLTGSLP